MREAYAALEAAWQAQHAEDEEVRSAFATIARDEANHASLSIDIDRWARGRLDAEAGRELDQARADALDALRRSVTDRATPPGLGLPNGEAAQALVEMVA